jgi:hypothetical protein
MRYISREYWRSSLNLETLVFVRCLLKFSVPTRWWRLLLAPSPLNHVICGRRDRVSKWGWFKRGWLRLRWSRAYSLTSEYSSSHFWKDPYKLQAVRRGTVSLDTAMQPRSSHLERRNVLLFCLDSRTDRQSSRESPSVPRKNWPMSCHSILVWTRYWFYSRWPQQQNGESNKDG